MQATVNLRVLDANTFLRDSLIGSYQFDLLGIYVEKVQYGRAWNQAEGRSLSQHPARLLSTKLGSVRCGNGTQPQPSILRRNPHPPS